MLKKAYGKAVSIFLSIGWWVGISIAIPIVLSLVPLALCCFAASILAAINVGRLLAVIFFFLGLAFWTFFVWIFSNRCRFMKHDD